MEGLAEGTGVDAGLTPSRRVANALFDIAFVESRPSYARVFPYATGPAFSELLDAVKPNWRRAITASSDVALSTMRAYRLQTVTPDASQARAIIARYGEAAIETSEAERAVRKATLGSKYRRDFIAGPTFALPMTTSRIAFNLRDVETLATYRSVCYTLTVTARWGRIDVSGGDAMISTSFRFVRVGTPPVLRGASVQGQGWIIKLRGRVHDRSRFK